MTILLSILLFLLVLTILVLVHELGHFLTAKAFGLTVKEFGLGIPPRAYGIKRGGTIYSLNYIPIGGFVSIAGEDTQAESGPGTFGSINRFKRSIVLVAGVAMNLILAIALLSGIFLVQGTSVPTGKIQISQVAVGSPAESAGLKEGDVITQVDGRPVGSAKDFQDAIKARPSQPVALLVTRSGQENTISLTPRTNPPVGQGAVGVVIGPVLEKKAFNWYEAPVEATKFSFDYMSQVLGVLGQAIVSLPTGGNGIGDKLSGPVGVAYTTYKVVQIDPSNIVILAALLSLSLALMNVLPIPALDGGRLAFVLISAVVRRDFYPKLERYIHTGGFIVVLLLIVLITYNDLVKIVTTTSLGGKIHEIFRFIP